MMENQANSIWKATAHSSQPRAALHEDIQTDVAIMGGGFTGLATAYFLQNLGLRTVILEQNFIGWGASGRNAGMLLTGYKKGISGLVKQFGLETAKELLDISIDSVKIVRDLVEKHDLNCSFSACGNLKAAYKPEHMERFKRNQEYFAKHFNYHTHILEKNEMHEELGSAMYYGALVDGHGASFHPLNYALDLANLIEQMGGTIFEQTPVTGIENNQDSVMIRTPMGQVKANKLVIATNGYTSSVTKKLSKSILPIGSYIIATERLDDSLAKRLIPQNRMISDSKKFLYYFRLTPDNRMLFGGRVSFNGKENPSMYKELRANMVSVFPELKEIAVDFGWGGMTGFTMDQFPHMGVTKEGYHYAMGYCGHGAAMSTWMGQRLALSIAGKENIANALERLPLRRVPMHSQRELVLTLMGAYYTMYDKRY